MASELPPSELGDEAYWRKFFADEKSSFQASGDADGTLEVWFGEHRQQRLIRFMLRQLEQQQQAKVLDVGCGNGALLVEFARESAEAGQVIELVGSDYTREAIELAQLYAQHETIEQGAIRFVHDDILTSAFDDESFDLIHDKGTYDAISLNEEAATMRVQYRTSIRRLLKKSNGVYVVTSCNWTHDELVAFFADDDDWRVCGQIEWPTLAFGGSKGSSVATAAFTRGIQ